MVNLRLIWLLEFHLNCCEFYMKFHVILSPPLSVFLNDWHFVSAIAARRRSRLATTSRNRDLEHLESMAHVLQMPRQKKFRFLTIC